MTRLRTTRNLFEGKPAKIVEITDPVMSEAIGAAEQKGCWFIYGAEKNGKTTFALQLAKDIALNEKVGYISAEEGLDKSFTDACRRAGIVVSDTILWNDYLSIEEITERFSRPKTPRVIFIDNLTIYQDEVKPSELKKKLIDALPNKLLILIGHEERNMPFPAVARRASKMAKVIFHVKGLKAFVVSRFDGGGGEIDISEEQSELYWGGANDND